MVSIYTVFQSCEPALAGRLALPQTLHLKLGKADLLLQMGQELAHPSPEHDSPLYGGR